ncbi:MAG: hypothetical protein KKA79_09665 [Nanoarchaeota archaeon]|nr:hypothetical protein [Nanoarchaeota archaeon]
MAKKKEEELGIAGAALKGIGKIVPGLGSLIEQAAKTEPFKERIKEVSKEVEKKLKGMPLRKEHIKIEHGFNIRPIIGKGKYREPIHPRVKRGVEEIKPEEPKKEDLVDVFDEKDIVRIVTELPGVTLKDIKIKIKGKKLTISAGKYHKGVELPSLVKKRIKKQYKNNILEIKLKKR